jgi:hypothetical protein
VLNTLYDNKGFSGKKGFLNFSDNDFSDVKYLYFLCSGMFSFWVRFGSLPLHCFSVVPLDILMLPNR